MTSIFARKLRLRPSVLALFVLLTVPVFFTIIAEDVEVRVSDSTAMVRYLVLPRRPEGTANYSEEELAALVTRDTMIGVVPVSIEAERAPG